MSEEVGYVISSREFLVYLDGLPNIRVNDMVESEQGTRGWVSALLSDRAEVLILDDHSVTPGQLFKRLERRLAINVGDFLLGRAINSLGLPIDGKGFLTKNKENLLELDREAFGIYSRHFIDRQFTTGVSLIDTLIPIGKGQRELVLGDAHSGKTPFLIDLIVNAKNSGVTCIYASIGKPITQVKSLIDTLRTNNALSHTVIIAAYSSEPAPLIFLTPQTAFTVAE